VALLRLTEGHQCRFTTVRFTWNAEKMVLELNVRDSE
jgi:hypothetical protein